MRDHTKLRAFELADKVALLIYRPYPSARLAVVDRAALSI
jgi:hypothetical protein